MFDIGHENVEKSADETFLDSCQPEQGQFVFGDVSGHFLALPHRQKIGVKHFGFEKVKLHRTVDDSGREFLRGVLKLWKNKAE